MSEQIHSRRALASALRVTPRAITALVDGLVETGFVTREPCPADRRAFLVTFTELGRTTAPAMADGKRELARHAFAGLPAEALDGLDAGLSHVIDPLLAASPSDGSQRPGGPPVSVRLSSLYAMQLPHSGGYLDG